MVIHQTAYTLYTLSSILSSRNSWGTQICLAGILKRDNGKKVRRRAQGTLKYSWSNIWILRHQHTFMIVLKRLQIFTYCSRSTWRVLSRNIRRSTAALNFELPAILRPARSRSLLLLLLNFRLHQVDRAFHSPLQKEKIRDDLGSFWSKYYQENFSPGCL